MHRYLLLTTLIAAPGVAWAQPPAFEARVVDADGAPVANAQVVILGHPGERFTDREGRILWRPAPAAPFEVLVILPGGRVMKPALVERVEPGEPFIVTVESLFTEAVTVTGGAAPGIEATPASATALLTATEIQVRGPANLAQVLENVPGVSSVSEGRAAVPVVRGFARGRTLILIDGARVSSERRAGASATFLDPFALESVEVSRGPGSVAYGSDAFGGVISARTRRVAPGARLSVRFVGSLGGGVPERRAGVEVGRGLRRGGVLVQAHVREFEDYQSPTGTVRNSGSHDRGWLARGEHALGPGILDVVWQSDYGRDIGRPRSNSHAVRFSYPIDDSHRLTGTYDVREVPGLDRLVFTGFYGRNRTLTDQDALPTVATTGRLERADVAAHDFQTRVLAERTVGPGHVEAGIDVSGRRGLRAIDSRIDYDDTAAVARTAEILAIDDASRTMAAGFTNVQLPLTSLLLLAGGLRGDRITTANRGGYFGDRQTAHGAASGYGSATAGFGRWSLTAQVARGFRDPVLSDRYFRGPSGRGFVTGNPELRPETSVQFDTALRYTGARYRSAFYLFSYHVDELVERYQTTPDDFFFRNRDRARMRGAEAELQGDFPRGVSLELSAQLMRGRSLDDRSWLDDVPPASVTMQGRKQIGTRGFAQLRVAAHARDTRPGPTEIVVPGYTLVDVSGGWRVRGGLEVRGLMRNLLDTMYMASQDPRTVPAPGRSVLLTLLARL